MRDFAKASLIDVVVLYLKQNNPGLLLADLDQVDALRNAHAPTDVKRDILETVRRNCGLKALLEIGQGIDSITYDPIWQAALRSETPQVLFDKWRRIETFTHSQNRVKISHISQNGANFQRYTMKGGKPGEAENLFVCGLVIALLQRIGCRGLWCDIAQRNGGAARVFSAGEFTTPFTNADLQSSDWTMGWQDFSPTANGHYADNQLLTVNLPPIDNPALLTQVKSVISQLNRDIARRWNVSELARASGLSTRSLQRHLSDAGLSFSRLVRLVRIHEACRLLRTGETPLTVIGFCAGFSDSAHFSRDFRASVGMTPTEYRTYC